MNFFSIAILKDVSAMSIKRKLCIHKYMIKIQLALSFWVCYDFTAISKSSRKLRGAPHNLSSSESVSLAREWLVIMRSFIVLIVLTLPLCFPLNLILLFSCL